MSLNERQEEETQQVLCVGYAVIEQPHTITESSSSTEEAGSKRRRTSKEIEDPFPNALKCRFVPVAQQQQLCWQAPSLLPLAVEESMISTLMHWKKTEKGMLKDQPQWRINKIRGLCKRLQVDMGLACSLRRHHIRAMHPFQQMSSLRLGEETNIREAAQVFENCVKLFLDQQRIQYYGEDEQKSHYAKVKAEQPNEPHPPTPDFLFQTPVCLHLFSRDSKKTKEQQRSIAWLEVKMFYGASTIRNNDKKSAVGCLLSTADKYTKAFGPGAIVFMYGCGDVLAAELEKHQVTVLDCSGKEIKLDRVYQQQRTWCANDAGHILP